MLLTVVGRLDSAEETGVPRLSHVGEMSDLGPWGLPVDGDPLLQSALEGRGAAGQTMQVGSSLGS